MPVTSAVMLAEHLPDATSPVPATPSVPVLPAVRGIRCLRLGAYALARTLRQPARIPRAWRDPGFAARIDRVRAQLLPIRSLAALADSYAREHPVATPGVGSPALAGPSPEVRLAYATRWLELTGRLDERPWRVICPPRAG
jgi:hypothetical protein